MVEYKLKNGVTRQVFISLNDHRTNEKRKHMVDFPFSLGMGERLAQC